MVVYPAPYKRGLHEHINLPAPIFPLDRRNKRLRNGHARAPRHRIKPAVGPIRARFFREQANYRDAPNVSRVRIHRQKPKELGHKFGCGFKRHFFHQGSPASGYRPFGGGCGVPWRAFFFAVMGCSGLARTGIAPI
jgi:hypothetical protein